MVCTLAIFFYFSVLDNICSYGKISMDINTVGHFHIQPATEGRLFLFALNTDAFLIYVQLAFN